MELQNNLFIRFSRVDTASPRDLHKIFQKNYAASKKYCEDEYWGFFTVNKIYVNVFHDPRITRIFIINHRRHRKG